MTDYAKELERYPDLEGSDRQELEKLASMQKDVAIGGSAEDFIRHPFFKMFENKMNEMIGDTKNKILEIETTDDLKAFKSRIEAIKELKQWLNSFVLKGRVASQAIDLYEKDTETINEKVQAIVDKSNTPPQ